jgi:hypothetical protein
LIEILQSNFLIIDKLSKFIQGKVKNEMAFLNMNEFNTLTPCL